MCQFSVVMVTVHHVRSRVERHLTAGITNAVQFVIGVLAIRAFRQRRCHAVAEPPQSLCLAVESRKLGLQNASSSARKLFL